MKSKRKALSGIDQLLRQQAAHGHIDIDLAEALSRDMALAIEDRDGDGLIDPDIIARLILLQAHLIADLETAMSHDDGTRQILRGYWAVQRVVRAYTDTR